MSLVKIKNSSLSGELTLPPSKSSAHRALICSYLAGGGTVSPMIDSTDMKATVGIIDGLKNNDSVLNCIESGSAVRFMIPVVASLGRDVTFVGEGSLLTRPLDEFIKLLPKHGVTVKSNGSLPFSISGQLKNGNFEIAGDVSSQYVTGLLLALANLEGDSAVVLTTPLQSKPYVDMTIKVMADYGVNVFETDFGYLIKGGQKFKQLDYVVEGDWSHSAFFLTAGAIGGKITLNGLDMNSTQGDKEIVNILKRFGANVEIGENYVTCSKGELNGITIDATEIPDMVPSLAVLGAYANGQTIIKGAQRLRYKESDRIKTVVYNLERLGADVTETQDGMIINGGKELHGANLKGFNDHRIVMAFSVGALFANGESVIDDALSINKSYPTFFDDYNRLGGKADVI
jgi:3-phosphoshikimate 1-carboxyvinyltransferase